MPAHLPKSLFSILAAKARQLSFSGRARRLASPPIPLKPMPPANRHYHETMVLNPAIITTPRLRHASTLVSGVSPSAASPVTQPTNDLTDSPKTAQGDLTQGDPVCTPRYTKVMSPAMDTLDPPEGIEFEPSALPDVQSQVPAERMRAPIPHAEKAATPASVLVEAGNSPLADPTPPKTAYEKVERAIKSALNPLTAQGEAAATSMALKKQGFDKMRGEDT